MELKKDTSYTESQPRSVGRPIKNMNKKKNKKVFVNLTESQKKQLSELAEEDDISLSRVCINALKEVGYIT